MLRRSALFLMLSLFLRPVSAVETILHYDSEIALNRDASMQVVETITVTAEGNRIKHGIFRDFPTVYQDTNGHRYQVGFKVLEALRDGNPEPFHVKKQSNGVRIYIGDKELFVEPGTYTYTLHYQTNRQLGFYSDHDELYWNVTGNNWRFPIKKTTATVYFPEIMPPDSVTLEAYTGDIGERGTDFIARQSDPQTVLFESTRIFNPGQGLTIVVGWPKDIIPEPNTAAQLHYFLDDNPESVIAGIATALVLGYYLFAWYRVGKDPEPGVIFPLYQPPKDFSPSAMRFVKRMHYDHKNLAVAIINLAVNGHLTIEEGASGKYVLGKKPSSASLSLGEKALIHQLFPAENRFIELKQSNRKQINKALDAHKKSLKLNYEKIYFLTNSSYLAPGIVISISALPLMLIAMPSGQQTETGLFFLFWLAIWSIGVFSLLTAAFRNWKNYFLTRSFRNLATACLNTLFAFPFAIGEFFGLSMLATEGSLSLALVLPLLVLINYFFYQWLKAPTLSGRALLDKIDGFKLYLSVAEKDELNYRHPPDKTPQLFEQFLPYALALDVEQQWSEKFAEALQQTDSNYQPRWFHSGHWRHDHFASFASSLGNNVASAVAASAAAPGSTSGSGGSGSSGGGGGGGGGGW